MSNQDELTKALVAAVATVRDEALIKLVQELMTALNQDGYQLSDVMYALVDYTATNPEWRQANYYLEQAAKELSQSR